MFVGIYEEGFQNCLFYLIFFLVHLSEHMFMKMNLIKFPQKSLQSFSFHGNDCRQYF